MGTFFTFQTLFEHIFFFFFRKAVTIVADIFQFTFFLNGRNAFSGHFSIFTFFYKCRYFSEDIFHIKVSLKIFSHLKNRRLFRFPRKPAANFTSFPFQVSTGMALRNSIKKSGEYAECCRQLRGVVFYSN